MRANPNAACAFEILFSTTPMRLADDVGLAHMAYVLPTQATSNISNNYWRDLVGHFYSISPTPVAANTTIFEISTWSRASGNANIVINVSNAAAGAYLQSNAANSTKMYVGINVNNSTYNSSINGTYELTKISNTQFRIVSASTTLISSQSGGTLTLVDPIMTNTQATFNRTSVVGTSDGTNHTYQIENLFQSGQLVDVVSSNSLWTVSGTIVSANANAFVINPQTASGTAAVSKTGLVATLSSGNTQVLLTTGNTSGLSNGQYLYKTSGTGAFGNSGNVYITSITNSTHFTVSTAHATSGSTTFNAVGALPAANTNTSTITADWSDKQVQLHKNYLPSQTDIYYILRLRHGAVTSGEYPIVIGENPNGLMAVTDLGQAKEITFAGQDAGWTDGLPPGYGLATTTETTVVTVTQTLNASDSAYYDNYGKGTGLTDPYAYRYSLYQGNPGTASGIKKSAVLFPSFTFNGTNGLTITKLEVYLRNRHSYKSSGLTAYIAAHKSTSLGTSVPLADDACPRVATTFTKGQGKWVELPSTWYSTFTSGGGGRGILLGVTDENPDTYYNGLDNYGYFDGYTMSDAPQFRITYQYNATVGSNNSSGGGGGSGGYVAV
jgi:hypothetical protein